MRSSNKSEKPAAGLILIAAFSTLMTFSTGAAADESVASWVDDQGLTHFGNTQLAPDDATTFKVAVTNSMDVPKNVPSLNKGTGPIWTVIEQPPKQNKKGWRNKGDRPRNGYIN